MKKKRLKYFFFVIFFFFCLVYSYNLMRGDTYVNYGFSYAILQGEIPYIDFNLVIPPFSPFFYSIFLIFSKSILCFYLGQAILLAVLFYILFQLLGKKAWLYFVFICIPYPLAMASVLFPGYNFLLLFLLFLLIYCEKQEKSDYLIGILLGCAFLTKQTVGGLLFLSSFYYLFSNYKKIVKRFLGFLIPVFISFCFFFFTNSFPSFLDLCFFGLFDFGKGNFTVDSFYLCAFLISFFYLLIRIVKRPKDIANYYVFFFASCILPIIDYYHVCLFLAAVVFLFLSDLVIQKKIAPYCILFVCVLNIIWIVIQNLFLTDLKIVSYPNFEFSMLSSKYINIVHDLDTYLESQEKQVIYFLRGSENYFYKIKNNSKITYFDLPNYGNYGYDGIEKLLKRLADVKNALIVIDMDAYSSSDPNQQYIKEAASYIQEHGKKVYEISYYAIYEME